MKTPNESQELSSGGFGSSETPSTSSPTSGSVYLKLEVDRRECLLGVLTLLFGPAVRRSAELGEVAPGLFYDLVDGVFILEKDSAAYTLLQAVVEDLPICSPSAKSALVITHDTETAAPLLTILQGVPEALVKAASGPNGQKVVDLVSMALGPADTSAGGQTNKLVAVLEHVAWAPEVADAFFDYEAVMICLEDARWQVWLAKADLVGIGPHSQVLGCARASMRARALALKLLKKVVAP